MALSKEQFLSLRKKGLSVEQIVSFERGQKPEDLRREKDLSKLLEGSEFKKEEEKGFFGKARDVVTGIIGGRKLAEGAGMALVSGEVIGGLSEEQRQTEELQNKILARIREKKEAGEDTSRLENTLKQSQGLAIQLQDVQKDFEEALPTSKEVIGSAARLAGTLAAGGVTRVAAKATALGKAVGIGQGALRGAGAGAISGGVLGGIQAAGLAAEQDKSTEEIIKSGLLGAGTGIAVGGVLGAVTGGITGALKQRALTKENFAKALATPKETTKVRAEAIRQGRLKDPGLFKKAELQFSKRDETLAKSIDDVVSPKATIGENVDAIKFKISQTNSGVKTYITQNKVPFNTNQLRSQLETGKDDLRLIFASDSASEKTYNAVSNAFMEHVKTKDTLGLFEARQGFDKIPAIKKLLESEGLGENTRREIVLAVRRSANNYIASLLPKDNIYRPLMQQESYMLEALENFSVKSAHIIGKNKIQLLSEEYPFLKWIVGGVAGGLSAGIGVGLGRGVGAGGSIIGSSD